MEIHDSQQYHPIRAKLCLDQLQPFFTTLKDYLQAQEILSSTLHAHINVPTHTVWESKAKQQSFERFAM